MVRSTVPIIFFRYWGLEALPAGILIISVVHCSAHAKLLHSPEAQLIPGRTTGAHPYLNGCIGCDEQRAIERAGHFYNQKIVFLMIGFNNPRHIEKASVRGPGF